MKLKNLFAMALAALCTVACSEEDNPKNPQQEAAEAVQGSYSGLMTMSVSGTSAGESEMTVQISAEDNGTVTVAFPALGSGSMQLEAFSVTGVTVSASDNGSYTLSKESFEATAGDLTVTGSNLAGTISSGEARITMDITPGSMPMSITCTFDTQAEPTAETVLADMVAGEYTGLMDMSVSGNSQGSSEMTLTLAAADDGTLTISVPAMGSGAMAMPAFDITGVTVSESENGDGTYTLTLDEFTVPTESLTLTGSSLTGTVNDGQMKLTMNIQPGAMPMAITFTFDTQAQEPSMAETVAGEYTGLMDMSVSGNSQGSSEMTLTLAAADDGTLTISVPAMGSGAMAMPAFDITGVTVSESENGDGTYTLTLDEFTVPTESLTLTGSSLTGTVNDGQMKLTMNIQPGAMPMAITFTFDTQDTAQGE